MSTEKTALERFLEEENLTAGSDRPWENVPVSGKPATFQFPEDAFFLNSPSGQAELTGLIQKVEQGGRDTLTVPEQKRLSEFEAVVPEVAQYVQGLEQQPEAPDKRVQAFDDIAREMKATVQEMAMLGKLTDPKSVIKMVDQFAMGLGELISPTNLVASQILRQDKESSEILKSGGLSQLLAENLTKAGFPEPVAPGETGVHINPRTGEETPYTHTAGSAIATNLAMGALRLAPELTVALIDNPYEFAKGLVSFPVHEVGVILDALNVQPSSVPGVPMTYGGASDEEVEAARDELVKNPIGVVMLGMMAYGAVRGGASTFRSISEKRLGEMVKETDGLKVENQSLKEAQDAIQKQEAERVSAEEQAGRVPEVQEAREAPEKVVPEKVVPEKVEDIPKAENLERLPEGMKIEESAPKSEVLPEKPPEMPEPVYSGMESADAARNLAHTKKFIKATEDFLKREDIPAELRTNQEGLLKQARLDEAMYQSQVKTIQESMAHPEQKTLSLDKAGIEKIRQYYPGIDQLPEARKKAMWEALDEAKRQGLDEKATELARAVIKAPRPITNAEYAGMTLKAAKLADEYDIMMKEAADLSNKGWSEQAARARLDAEGIIQSLDELTTASDLGGREVARALQIRQMRLNRESYTMADLVRTAKARKGKPLTEQETAAFQEIAERHEKLQKEYEDLLQKYDTEKLDREKAIAESVLEQTRVREKKSKSAKESIAKERSEIKKGLMDLGFRVNEFTGVSTEASYLIGKLALTYIKEGAETLKDVASKVRTDIPEITDHDVYQGLITKDPNFVAKAKTETAHRVERLKREAKLLTDIEKAENGIFDPIREKPVVPRDIKELRGQLRKLRSHLYRSNMESARLEKALQTINELQDHLANGTELMKRDNTVYSPEMQAAREKIADLRKQIRIEDEIARLQEQMETGIFDVSPRVQTERYLPEEVEKAQVRLLMTRKEARAMQEALEPITKKKVYGEIVNTLRTAKATADFSAALRQGLLISAKRPVGFARAYGKSFQAFFSNMKAEQIDAAIRGADHHWIREKSGLYLAPLERGAKLSTREEYFMANWYNRVPIVKQTMGTIVRASERHMITHLNVMRATAFDEFYRKFPNATREELSAWAQWVNVASGRGKLGRFREASNTLSTLMFAPRFTVSRFQAPAQIFKSWSMPRVRWMIAKDMAATGGLAMTTLGLAQLAGLEVGTDPMDADLGKIIVGNTRIDMFAGFQQPVRLLISIGLSALNQTGLTPEWYAEMNEKFDPGDAFWRFAQYKAAPAITLPKQLIWGKDLVGDEKSVGRTAIEALVPLVYADVYDAYKDAGFGRALMTGALSFHGVGVNTYEDGLTKTRNEITKAFADGDFTEALRLSTDWNMAHPGQKIGTDWMMGQMFRVTTPGTLSKNDLTQEMWKRMEEK